MSIEGEGEVLDGAMEVVSLRDDGGFADGAWSLSLTSSPDVEEAGSSAVGFTKYDGLGVVSADGPRA